MREFIQSREFYDLMQAYRHAPLTPQVVVQDAFEAVKAALLEYTPLPTNGDLGCAGCGGEIKIGQAFNAYCCGEEGPQI